MESLDWLVRIVRPSGPLTKGHDSFAMNKKTQKNTPLLPHSLATEFFWVDSFRHGRVYYQHHHDHRRIRSGEPRALSGPATAVRTCRLSLSVSLWAHNWRTRRQVHRSHQQALPSSSASQTFLKRRRFPNHRQRRPSAVSIHLRQRQKIQTPTQMWDSKFFFSLTLNFLREQTKIIYIISL